MSNLLKKYDVPANVRTVDVCPVSVEIYDDHVTFHGKREASYFYKDFTGISTQKGSLFCAYACIIFLNSVSANQTFKNDLPVLTDMNRVLFCSGMFSYKPANECAEMLAKEIRAALEQYKINPHTETEPQASAADEIKKFKELLDIGAITQAEFDEKKKQLLGL